MRLPSSSQKGFTAVEMMAVIAIVGALIAIGIYSFRPSRDLAALKADVRAFEGDLAMARTAARTRNEPVLVALIKGTQSYDICIDRDSSGGCATGGDDVILRKGRLSGEVRIRNESDTVTRPTFVYSPTGMTGMKNEIFFERVDGSVSTRFRVSVYITGRTQVDASENAVSWRSAW